MPGRLELAQVENQTVDKHARQAIDSSSVQHGQSEGDDGH